MTFQPDLFKGKHALVTGATQGIGAAVANVLASLGASVTAVGIDQGDGSLDARVDVTLADVSSEADVAALFRKLATLDILVNCAGIIRRGAEHDVAVFEQVVAVNLTGTMRICSGARPLLAARRGVIVNTASMLSFFGGALVPGYAASKGGIAQLTKSLALAYASDGIRVNAVAPGWIATPLTQALQEDQARGGSILQRTPLGRWGQPERTSQTLWPSFALPRPPSLQGSSCRSTAATWLPERATRCGTPDVRSILQREGIMSDVIHERQEVDRDATPFFFLAVRS